MIKFKFTNKIARVLPVYNYGIKVRLLFCSDAKNIRFF